MDISTIDILFGDDIMAKEQLKTLTEPMYYILLTLSEPQHGYGIMQEVERRTEGRVKIGAGTLYNLLSRFEDENIYITDLINFDAYDEKDNLIGSVVDYLEVPQGYILELETKEGQKVLVPYVDEFIKEIDFENQEIIIHLIEGML